MKKIFSHLTFWLLSAIVLSYGISAIGLANNKNEFDRSKMAAVPEK